MISEKASIGEGTSIGAYTVIEDDAVIGRECVIGHHAVIRSGTVVGDRVRIDDFADIGKLPMKAAGSAVTKEEPLEVCRIGDGCIIGTHAVLYRGCVVEEKTLVADLASVREHVHIGKRTIIGRGAAVENFCEIGSDTKIETNAYITAHSVIGEHCFIAPGVVTSNDNFAGRTEERFERFQGVTVENGGRIGAGCVVLPGKVIGADALAAAGSVVTKDAPPEKVVLGSPAKVVGDVPSEQLLERQRMKPPKRDA
ncbi:acyltransferase [Candidatus Soleaferrea massiliensis]|uniref:acyltransferase n=1 Tax=Candidatus Soleaferrea massiliensis TaxID=1470354 RepID=UPI00058CDE28|nr:acyltransferase [Candidatus Soleaferrea massiliensis]